MTPAVPHPDPRLVGGPFLRRDGLKAGLTKHSLDGPGFLALFGAVRVHASTPVDARIRARAVLLVMPHAVISDHTAAQVWGGIVPETGSTHVTVESASRRSRRAGVVSHVRSRVAVVEHDGVRVTPPELTFVHLADRLTLVDLVVLGDSLVRRGATSPAALRRAARASTSRSRARARRAADLVRERVDSPMETRVRLLLLLAGLPEPIVNLELGDGDRRFRLDLSWPELRLAVEYDGRHHAEDPGQWGRDLGRREWFDAAGWRLIVLRSDDVYVTPWATVVRVVDAMRPRGYDKPLGAPPAELLAHFPGRRTRTA